MEEITAIVYKSNTGFTKQYAEILALHLGIPLIASNNIKKQLQPHEKIIFMGWIFASVIKDLKKIKKKYNLVACCGVGISAPSEKLIEELKARNNIHDIPFFYLQGGIDRTKLKGYQKIILNLITKIMSKKEIHNPEEVDVIEAMQYGRSFVNRTNLENIIMAIKK